VHVRGAGLEETPFHRLMLEEERTRPERKWDFIKAVDRTQQLMRAKNNPENREDRMFEELERVLEPLIREKYKMGTEEGR